MTNVTLQFLNAILPDEGLRVAAWSDGSGFKHSWHNTNEELADALLLLDQRGFAAYHACASYMERGSRKSDNVHQVQALWLDIDAGRGKPYGSATEAYEGCRSFCRATGMPDPLYVGSGNGLHAYWPLSLPLSRSEWQRYAAGLKALCARHGLHADPSRTADAASILRPPGTHNRKNGEVLVQMGEDVGCFDLDQFSMLLGAAPAVVASVPKTAWLEAATNTTTYAPADPLKIAEVCRHVAVMEETGGDLPEPYWYDLLGVLAFCEDVEVWAHEWSRGYEGYSYAETQAKLEQRKRAASGATTCVKIEGHNPALCNGCPLKGQGRSPISIGRDASLQAPPVIEAEPSEGETKLPVVGQGFIWKDNWSLWHKSASKGDGSEGDEKEVLVANKPLVLVHTAAAEHTNSHNYIARIWDSHSKGWNEVSLTAETIFGRNASVAVAEHGVVVHNPDKFRQYIRLTADSLMQTKRTETRYEQFGWRAKGTFICGARAYRDGEVRPAFAGDNIKDKVASLTPTGDARVWKQAVEGFLKSSTEAHALPILSSFAAVFMTLQDAGDGGCILSLTEPNGGQGKSTALEAAASVWGGEDLVLQVYATHFARASSLRNMRNLPVFFDEALPKDTEEVHQFIDMFSGGREKLRGKRDGGVFEALPWATILMTASNYSLAEMAEANAEIGGRVAPRSRVFEVSVKLPEGDNSTVGDAFRRDFQQNYGHAGHAFLSVLTRPTVFSSCKQALVKETEAIVETLKARPAHRYWTRYLGCLVVAEKMLRVLKLIDYDFSKTVAFAMERCKEMISDTPLDTKGDDAEKARTVLTTYLDENVGKIYVVGQPIRTATNAVVGRQDGDMLYLSKQPLHKYLADKRISIGAVARALKDARVFMPDFKKQVRLLEGSGMKGMRTMCYAMDLRDTSIKDIAGPVIDNVVELKNVDKRDARKAPQPVRGHAVGADEGRGRGDAD